MVVTQFEILWWQQSSSFLNERKIYKRVKKDLQTCNGFLVEELIVLFWSLSKEPFWSLSKRYFWSLNEEPFWSLSKEPFLYLSKEPFCPLSKELFWSLSKEPFWSLSNEPFYILSNGIFLSLIKEPFLFFRKVRKVRKRFYTWLRNILIFE